MHPNWISSSQLSSNTEVKLYLFKEPYHESIKQAKRYEPTIFQTNIFENSNTPINCLLKALLGGQVRAALN
jgi:hypothetical protein